MMEVQRAVAMRLPDGSHIKLEVYGSEYVDGNSQNQSWMSLDIARIHAGGREELLASIDYDDTKGLRTLVFDSSQADPIFSKEDKVK